MNRTRRPTASALAAAGLTALLALPSAAQDSPAVPDLDPDDCSNGTFVTNPSANPGLVADCRALVAVRNHWTRHPDNADLPTYHPLLTWGQADTVDAYGTVNIASWHAVSVLAERGLPPRVDSLGLRDISGTIPPELGQLTKLSHLNLSSNQLTGPIPPELGQLTNLRVIYLFDNQLTSIPPELGQLTKLSWLYLDGNQLTRIPPEFSQLTTSNISFYQTIN